MTTSGKGYVVLVCGLLSASGIWARDIVWRDEFDGAVGSGPAETKWVAELGGGGWGNAELQTYTARRENSQIVEDPEALDGKALAIIARREGDGYTSARLVTQGKFGVQYGRIEARLKMPAGRGLWPAFWALGETLSTEGWPHCGEIDIMEWVGQTPGTVRASLHGPGYSGIDNVGTNYDLPSGEVFSGRYHVFAVEWTPEGMEFSVDGKVYATPGPKDLPAGAKWVYDRPFYLLLNLAVGGHWPGSPTPETAFPQEYRIDYVRVFAPLVKP